MTYPSSDVAIPADDRVGDPSVITDNSVGQDDGTLQADTGTNFSTGTDDHIGSDDSGRINFGSLSSAMMRRYTHLVDQDVASVNPFVL
jgi:hypothetical protein